MVFYHVEKLLILTKTYPTPSRKYQELSCVAAINENGELRRLFPIPYRHLGGDQQFHRWEWIRARVTKANDDHRPESYKVDLDSITRIHRIGTNHGWAERLGWIKPHYVADFTALDEQRILLGKTLGFFRPTSFNLSIKAADTAVWTPEEREKLIQNGLFDYYLKKPRELKKVPYDFYYLYNCESTSGTTNHKHKITDWEIGMLYWHCFKKYGNQWEEYFRKKIETSFSREKEVIFLMGTMHRFPDAWLIVGLIYPPKSIARQQVLLLPPSD